jgi:hypothetical protein
VNIGDDNNKAYDYQHTNNNYWQSLEPGNIFEAKSFSGLFMAFIDSLEKFLQKLFHNSPLKTKDVKKIKKMNGSDPDDFGYNAQDNSGEAKKTNSRRIQKIINLLRQNFKIYHANPLFYCWQIKKERYFLL